MRALPTRYRPIGRSLIGGMGSVIICSDEVLERQVAIKFIHNTTHRRRMHDELTALLKMRSKHVVQVYDILHLENNELGIVLEFIDGQDLLESRQDPSSAHDFYKQLWQIASGIRDIHALGVIHRDIKPNNIKTDPEGVIKIFDFGLARDEGLGAATIGFIGTPGFAAPELYAAFAKFTPAVDTYAFGATALYLAIGNFPAELQARPPKPRQGGYFTNISLQLPSEIIDSLDACLSAAPNDRPSMSSVHDVLAKHLLHDRHQALVVFEGQASYLNSTSRSVNLNLPTIGQMTIKYDGLVFLVTAVAGEVFLNNQAVSVGDILPGSCVASLGGPNRQPSARKYVTFDVSHPEVVI